jgi:predicted dehydrogenase
VQFVAVCDVDTNHTDSAKGIIDKINKNSDCRTYVDYREFLEKEKIDAVSIALPDHWHGLIYSAAANKKLDIYGEKPLARTIQDGRAIVSAVKKNNVVWQTGSWQRSGKMYRRAAELAINGRVGKITRVEVGLPDGDSIIGTPPVMEVPAGLNWDLWLGPAPKVPYRGICHGDWRWTLDYSGGRLTDWAGHHVDIAAWGIGMDRTGPVEIEGMGIYPLEGLYNTPVEFDFTCKYANGIEMRVATGSRLRFNTGAAWFGEKGWIHVDRDGGLLHASDPKILEEVIGENEIQLYKSNNHFWNFLECVRSRGETVCPVEVGHRSISIGLLGEIAMTTGQKIEWDPIREEIIGSSVASRLLSRPYRQPWIQPTI